MKYLAGTQIKLELSKYWTRRKIQECDKKNKPRYDSINDLWVLDCIVAGYDYSKGISIAEINSGDVWLCLIPSHSNYEQKFKYYTNRIAKDKRMSYINREKYYKNILKEDRDSSLLQQAVCPFK